MGFEIFDDWFVVLVFLARFAKRHFLALTLDEGFGHIVAAGISAGAAVIVREHILDFLDARIFLDMEELGGKG